MGTCRRGTNIGKTKELSKYKRYKKRGKRRLMKSGKEDIRKQGKNVNVLQGNKYYKER